MLNRFPALKKHKKILLISFFLPFSIMFIIYAVMGVYPFGENTLLTVDLGQQYIDFFSYYRHTLLHEPKAFFYSFSKGIGGEMVGLWSYYLTSPFNLLMLLVPQRFLPVGVTILMLLKISLSGLSFAYLLIKKFDGKDALVPAFSLSYALMAYVIANQLNVMWLDGLVFLPLMILGVEKLVDNESGLFYSMMLAVMLFSQYYIGYMICIFLVFYFLFALAKQQWPSSFCFRKKVGSLLWTSTRFAFFSLLGAGLAAFILLPNFFSLLGGKASYTNEVMDWSFSYPFQEVLSKFYVGSFNFDQMPSGHPNLFIGSLALVGFLFYFFNPRFSKKERITAFLITVFFFFSMNIKFLNKIWHGFQYPIWYPYRFSFVVSFFFLLNGFRSIQKNRSFPLWFACFLLILQTGSALYVLGEDFDFVIPLQVFVTVLFLILTLVLLLLREDNRYWVPILLLLVTTAEMTTNAAIDLTRLSYVKMKPFNDYQLVLEDMLQNIRPQSNEFYRIEKLFQRSKNDSFQANYPSATHFSSTFEKEIPQFYGHLGFPDGNGFVSYSTGTLFTDAFFGIRYFGINQPLPENLLNNPDIYSIRSNSTRPDMQQYDFVSESTRTAVYQNPYALPLAFGVPDKLSGVELKKNSPIRNQEAILSSLSREQLSSFYIEETFDSTVIDNISSSLKGSINKTYTKEETEKDASLELQFTPRTNEPYYMVLDSRIGEDQVDLYLNDEPFSYYKTYRTDQIFNLASNQEGESIRFRFSLKEDTLTIRDLKLYRFNLPQFEAMVEERKAEGMTLTSFSQTHLKGEADIGENDSLLLTTIPYSEGWQVWVDGKEAENMQVLDSLLAVPITSGYHKIEFKYQVPYLKEGVMVTGGSLFILAFLHLVPAVHPRRKTSKNYKRKT